jgi:hypothetical protein
VPDEVVCRRAGNARLGSIGERGDRRLLLDSLVGGVDTLKSGKASRGGYDWFCCRTRIRYLGG